MKHILFYLIILISTSAFGQNFKKSVVVDGNFNYYHKNYDGQWIQKTSKASFNPSLAYGISNRIMVGVGMNYAKQDTLWKYPEDYFYFGEVIGFKKISIVDQVEEYKKNTIGVNLFIAYYQPLVKNLYLSGRLTIGGSKENTDLIYTLNEYPIETTNYFETISLTSSMTYAISNRVYVYVNFASIGYTMGDGYKNNGYTEEISDEINFDVLPNTWTFGMMLRLDGQKE